MHRVRWACLSIAILFSGFGAQGVARAAELVYFNSSACPVCEQWDEEVGAIYDRTDEARRLPLRPVSIHDDKPADLAFIKGVIYTPTFVMVENGQEVGRIVGYIADYFFWEQIAGLLKKTDGVKGTPVAACPHDSGMGFDLISQGTVFRPVC